MKCGKPLADETQEYCADCEENEHAYAEGRAVWIYDDLLRDMIADYKYRFKKEYAEFFAWCAVKKLGGYIRDIRPDVIIPVPISRKRCRKRGYNQAAAVSNIVGSCLNIPTDTHSLRRGRSTLPQKELDPSMRLLNLSKAFYTEKKLSYKTVLIIDDIYTTGSTMDACAAALKKAGVKKVYFAALCIGADNEI